MRKGEPSENVVMENHSPPKRAGSKKGRERSHK